MSDPANPPEPQFVPRLILSLRQGYRIADFSADAAAGLAIAIVALPLSIAIAIAAGVPPQLGLTTIIVGGVVVSLLGGSRTAIGGVTGAFIALLYTTVHNFGLDGLFTATFLAGAIMLIAGLLRLGTLVEHVPKPVVRGFLFGISLIVAMSQIKDAIGLEGPALPAAIFAKAAAIWSLRDSFNPVAAVMTVGTIATIVAFRRIKPKWPGLVLAVILAGLIAAVFDLPVETIDSRFGPLSLEVPPLQLPDLSLDRLRQLLPTALAIAFLAGVESLLAATVADRMTGDKHSPNMEIVAQGAANAVAACFGGLPVSGALSRTAANIIAGGRTPVAGIMQAFYVTVFLLFAAPLVGYLTLPSLAAVLLMAVWQLADPKGTTSWWHQSRHAGRLIFVFTALLTVFLNLISAIVGGILFTLVLRLIQGKEPTAQADGRREDEQPPAI